MAEYVRWSWLQLYLLAFQPTRFRLEVEDERRSSWTARKRLWYLARLLPWIALLAVLGNLAVGRLCEAFGLPFRWHQAWNGVALGVSAGIALGVAAGVSIGIAGSVAGGIGIGIGVSVSTAFAMGVAIDVPVAVTLGATLGVSSGIAFGLAYRDAKGVAVGIVFGVSYGIALGAAFGVAFGIAVGIAVGVAGAIVVGIAVGVAGPVAIGIAAAVAGGLAVGVGAGVALAIPISIAFSLMFWVTYYRLLTYPLDLAMAYLAERHARRGLEAARKAFRICPVSWNEVIWLPLPFVRPLLVRLVRLDRDEGLRHIAFVAAERPLQRRAALGALSELAIDDLGATSIREIAEVTHRLGWLTDSPLGLPKELASTLPIFDRIAQHASQSLSIPNAYRKREALVRALDELKGLEHSLIIARGRHVPMLLVKAEAWRKLVAKSAAQLAAEAEATRELPNPFIFGSPLHERNSGVFAGRQDIVQAIERAILGSAQAPTLLLHGPRRMGKTSILKQLPRLLGPDFAPAEVDCQLPSFRESPVRALLTLSGTISAGLRRRHVRLPALHPDHLKHEPFSAFADWLNATERAMPPALRAVLCLDEIEKLSEHAERSWGTDLLDLLRHIAQHHPRIVLLFTGAHTFAELGPIWTDRFLGVRRVLVTHLRPEEVRRLLTPEIPGFDLNLTPEAIDALIEATRGQPFLTQAVAFELVQHLNECKARRAELRNVEAAIEHALESGEEYFGYLWRDAGLDGQAVLTAAALDQAPPNAPAVTRRLRDQGVLNEDGRFVVPMVERWVRTKRGRA